MRACIDAERVLTSYLPDGFTVENISDPRTSKDETYRIKGENYIVDLTLKEKYTYDDIIKQLVKVLSNGFDRTESRVSTAGDVFMNRVEELHETFVKNALIRPIDDNERKSLEHDYNSRIEELLFLWKELKKHGGPEPKNT